MTRGTAYVLLPNNKVIGTTEFNGDMYIEPGSYGELMINCLGSITEQGEVKQRLEDFNKKTHNYNDKIVYEDNIQYINENELHYKKAFTEEAINHSENSFGDWFSDYIFIRNISGQDVIIYGEESIGLLKNNDTMVINFGTIKYEYGGEEIGTKDDSGELREYDDDEFVDDDIDNEHIAQMITEGFTSGQLNGGGWWELNKTR